MPDCAVRIALYGLRWGLGEGHHGPEAAQERPRVPGAALVPFAVPKGNEMSNKAHLRPHKRQQQGNRNRLTALLLVLLFIALLALSVLMVSSGHVIPPGVR